MTKQEIDAVFERVRTWPEERQELAAALLLELEAGDGDVYVLSDEERAAIEEAEAELDRGEVASDEEVKALFACYRSR